MDLEGLKVLDFQEKSVLVWLAELMKHRDAADSKRYHILADKSIEKYGMETSEYDIIKGWRANASYLKLRKYLAHCLKGDCYAGICKRILK